MNIKNKTLVPASLPIPVVGRSQSRPCPNRSKSVGEMAGMGSENGLPIGADRTLAVNLWRIV